LMSMCNYFKYNKIHTKRIVFTEYLFYLLFGIFLFQEIFLFFFAKAKIVATKVMPTRNTLRMFVRLHFVIKTKMRNDLLAIPLGQTLCLFWPSIQLSIGLLSFLINAAEPKYFRKINNNNRERRPVRAANQIE